MGGYQAHFFSGTSIPEGSLGQEKSSLIDAYEMTLKDFPNHGNKINCSLCFFFSHYLIIRDFKRFLYTCAHELVVFTFTVSKFTQHEPSFKMDCLVVKEAINY